MGAADAFLLDAYSQTVGGVVERAGPSVASVRVSSRILLWHFTFLMVLSTSLRPDPHYVHFVTL
jgi:hypothetical protein